MTLIYLHLPDLVTSCPFPRGTNPHFDRASAESAAWVDGYSIFPEADSKRAYLIMSNGSLLASYVYPYCDYDKFRISCDFMNLLFALDEISDGHDKAGGYAMVDTFVNALNDKPCDGSLVSRITKDFMGRLIKPASNFRRRLISHLTDCINTVPHEADLRERGEVFGIDEYITHRRENGAVRPCFDIIEYNLGIDLPDKVFEDPAMKRLYFAAVDMVCWSNDVYSYAVERSRGLAGNNAITILMRTKGLSMQEAADYIGSQFQVLQDVFIENKSLVNSFGEVVDKDVQLYISGLEYWVVGNLLWSFDSQRYFGRNNKEVKRTLIVPIQDAETAEDKNTNVAGEYWLSLFPEGILC